jgi:CheY-like chemotaxis protein
MGIDKRDKKRVTYDVNILIGNKMRVRGIDISESGVFVHTGRSFQAGSIVEITIPIHKRTLTVRAKVQHDQKCIGMGLKFIDLDIVQKNMIKEYIERRAAKESQTAEKKKKILLITDDERLCRMNKSRLILDGLLVNDFTNTRDAFIFIKTEIPDLIVLDIDIEDMNAVKVITALKESRMWRDVRIIICSSKGTPDFINKVINAGADEFLVKASTSPAKLSSTVASFFK